LSATSGVKIDLLSGNFYGDKLFGFSSNKKMKLKSKAEIP